MKKVREDIVDCNLSISDDTQGEILISEETTFHSFLEKEDHEFDNETFDDNQAYQNFLFFEFKHSLGNKLHAVIFWNKYLHGL